MLKTELGPGAVEIPERLAILAQREKSATPIGTNKAAFKSWLTATFGT